MSSSPNSAVTAHETVQGTVKAVNFAPKGEIDGLLIDVGGTMVQVNIPPDQAEQVQTMIGQEVAIEVGPEPKVAEHPKGNHRIYKIIAFADQPKPDPKAGHPKPKPPHHEHAEPTEVTGQVERLNYAKHGEANGVVLATGDFVHLKPAGMKQVDLKVGQPVTVQGKGRPSPSGGRAIDAEVVNGVTVGPKQPH